MVTATIKRKDVEALVGDASADLEDVWRFFYMCAEGKLQNLVRTTRYWRGRQVSLVLSDDELVVNVEGEAVPMAVTEGTIEYALIQEFSDALPDYLDNCAE